MARPGGRVRPSVPNTDKGTGFGALGGIARYLGSVGAAGPLGWWASQDRKKDTSDPAVRNEEITNRRTRPNFPASYEHRYASQAGSKAKWAQPKALTLDEQYMKLLAMLGGTGDESSSVSGLNFDPEEMARRIINPGYDAQISALNMAAQRAQENANRGKAETGAGYQAIYNMMGKTGTQMGQVYDTGQEEAAKFAKEQQDTINASYNAAKAEQAAEAARLGIVGDPTSKLAAEQANATAMAARDASAGRTASEALQTSSQNYYTGMGAASQLEGQAQQQALLRQLADTMAGYEGEKVTLEGKRQGDYQKTVLDLMEMLENSRQSAKSNAPSFSDKLSLMKFLQEGQGGGEEEDEGPAPTKGASALMDYFVRDPRYGASGRLNSKGKGLSDFLMELLITDSGLTSGKDAVTYKAQNRVVDMTPQRAAQIAYNQGKKRGYTGRI